MPTCQHCGGFNFHSGPVSAPMTANKASASLKAMRVKHWYIHDEPCNTRIFGRACGSHSIVISDHGRIPYCYHCGDERQTWTGRQARRDWINANKRMQKNAERDVNKMLQGGEVVVATTTNPIPEGGVKGA